MGGVSLPVRAFKCQMRLLRQTVPFSPDLPPPGNCLINVRLPQPPSRMAFRWSFAVRPSFRPSVSAGLVRPHPSPRLLLSASVCFYACLRGSRLGYGPRHALVFWCVTFVICHLPSHPLFRCLQLRLFTSTPHKGVSWRDLEAAPLTAHS